MRKRAREALWLFLALAALAVAHLSLATGNIMQRYANTKRRLLEDAPANQLGASTTLNAGDRKSILQNQASDNLVQLVTIYLYAAPTGTQVGIGQGFGFTGNRARVVFEVKFGVGGATQFVVLASAKQGTALTLAASSVEVTAFYNELAGQGAPQVTAGAVMAYGSRPPGVSPASFEQRVENLPSNDLQTLSVPPFAREMVLTSANSADGVQFLRAEFGGGFPPAVLGATAGVAGQKVLTFPVPDGADSVEITNNSAGSLTFNVSWTLGI